MVGARTNAPWLSSKPRVSPSKRVLRRAFRGQKCTATKQNGQPCPAWAVQGTSVCSVHGGLAPQTLQAGRLRLIELYRRHHAWRTAISRGRWLYRTGQIPAWDDAWAGPPPTYDPADCRGGGAEKKYLQSPKISGAQSGDTGTDPLLSNGSPVARTRAQSTVFGMSLPDLSAALLEALEWGLDDLDGLGVDVGNGERARVLLVRVMPVLAEANREGS